jgi:hypothetical protein
MPSANFGDVVGLDRLDPRGGMGRRGRTGTCQPCQLRAGTSISCSVSAISPAVTFSPEETTASYSRASKSGEVSSTQPTSSLVFPAMADTMTITS